jgi:hypothetical protein
LLVIVIVIGVLRPAMFRNSVRRLTRRWSGP